MRHGMTSNLAADTVESQIGDVMLSATIEAPADLDMQLLYGFVGHKAFFTDLPAEFGRKSARGRYAEFASIGSGARGDIHQRASSGIGKAHSAQGLVEVRQIALSDPANHEVLLDSRANGLFSETAHDVCQGTQLIGSDVAQRQSDIDGDVSGLALRPNIKLQPTLEVF